MQKLNPDECITPDYPYCPFCEYGLVIYPEDGYGYYDDCEMVDWICLYNPSANNDKSGE